MFAGSTTPREIQTMIYEIGDGRQEKGYKKNTLKTKLTIVHEADIGKQ